MLEENNHQVGNSFTCRLSIERVRMRVCTSRWGVVRWSRDAFNCSRHARCAIRRLRRLDYGEFSGASSELFKRQWLSARRRRGTLFCRGAASEMFKLINHALRCMSISKHKWTGTGRNARSDCAIGRVYTYGGTFDFLEKILLSTNFLVQNSATLPHCFLWVMRFQTWSTIKPKSNDDIFCF